MIAKGFNRFHRSYITKMRLRFCMALVVFALLCWVSICEPFGIRNSDAPPLFAFVSLLALLFYSMAVFGRGYCCFHPYFARRLNRDGGKPTYGSGQHIAANLDELDKLATEHHVRALSSFGYKDSFSNSKVEWHSPRDGINTIMWLLANDNLDEMTRTELSAILDILQVAMSQNNEFCFHMKFADGTNAMEHEQREGSYW